MPQSTHSVLRVALRRWLVAVLLLTAPLVAVIATFYRQDQTHERELVGQRAKDTLDLAAEKIERELRAVKSDVLFLSRQTGLRRYLQHEANARAALESDYVTFAQERGIYDQIRLLNLEGDEVIRVNYKDGRPSAVPESELQPKSTRYYFQQAVLLQPGEIFISPMDLNEEHGTIEVPHKPVIRFVTPVFDTGGVRNGYLVLNYLGEHLLTEFKESTVALPGEKYVANAEGEFLDSPNRDDNWGWLLGHQRSLRSQFPAIWPDAAQGQLQEKDAAGLFTSVRLEMTSRPATANSAGEASAKDESHKQNGLLMVSRIPWTAVDVRSELLLQRLIATAAGALVLLGVLAGYWAHASAVRQEQRQRLAESESRLRTLSRQLLHAQEEERKRISRDLHDDLSQQITAISLNLQSAQKQTDMQKLHSRVSQGVEGARQLLASVHRIAGNLRPSVLDDLAFVTAMESLVSEFEASYPLTIERAFEGINDEQIGDDLKENVYRIVQEALSNAARHSGSKHASVRVTQTDDRLRIRVADQGCGFRPEDADASRLGLLGMRERAELLGGEFHLQAEPGAGATIMVDLPIWSAPA